MFCITNDIFLWTTSYSKVGSGPHGPRSGSTAENPTRHAQSVEMEPNVTIEVVLDGEE